MGSLRLQLLEGESVNFEFKEIKIAIGEENVFSLKIFLSDSSSIIALAGLVTNSLTHSLSNSCSVDLIDATLACEGANFKLVDGVTVADIVSNVLLLLLSELNKS